MFPVLKKILEVPKIVRHLETQFFVNEKYKCRLYYMTVIDDKEVFIGGSNGELKIIDLVGNLHGHRTVPIKGEGLVCVSVCITNISCLVM